MITDPEVVNNLNTFYIPEYQEYENEYDINSYFSDEIETVENTSNLSFSNKKNRQSSGVKSTLDGSYIMTRVINDVRVKIQCFATKSVMGTRIRSATTGIAHNMFVGKIDEDLFFKVRMVNGEVGKSGYGNDFYYDSPEEYERHLFIKVPQIMKEQWVEKNRVASLRKKMHEIKANVPEFIEIK